MVRRASGCKDAFDQLLFTVSRCGAPQYFRHQCSTGSSLPRVPLCRKGYAASVSGKAANGCAVAACSLGGRRGLTDGRLITAYELVAGLPGPTGQRQQRIGARIYPRHSRAKGLNQGAFPSLTAARDSQPSPAGGRVRWRRPTRRSCFLSTGRGALSPAWCRPCRRLAFDTCELVFVSMQGPRRAPQWGSPPSSRTTTPRRS